MPNQTLPFASTPSEDGSLEKLQAELFPGEQLLWHGRPVQGMRIQRSTIVGYVIGGLLLAGILLLFLFAVGFFTMPDEWKDWRDRDPLTQARIACWFWIVPLSPCAAYCLGWGQWLDARIRNRFFYGVTNERILMLRASSHGSGALTSLRLQDVPHLRLITAEDGTGSLSFVAQTPQNANHPIGFLNSFYQITDVRKVYTLIRSIQRDPPAKG